MFEEKYRKYYQEMTPSEELNEETLALMMEARDHRAAEPNQPVRRKSLVWIPIAATAAAAMVALVIVGAWTRGDTYEDMAGDLENAFSESIPGTDIPDEDPGAAPEGSDQATPDDSLADQTEPEQNKSDSSTSSDDENKSEPGSTQPDDPAEGEDQAGSNAGGADDSTTEEEEDATGGNTNSSPTPADPYAPVVSTAKKTATYLSLRDFLNALAKKETTGYGSKYYNARELIIVPNLLPDGARFRHLHLNTENGKYSYSYLFTNEGKNYIIDIEVNAKTPKTLRDLNLQKQAIAEEEILTGKKENHLYYLFGTQDEVTVTVTAPESDAALTEEQVATLLEQFKLERCSLTNTVIDMKY